MDNKTIKHTASLSRISLTEKEEEKMKNELGMILKYVDQLNEVNTDGIEPLYQTTGLVNSVREDIYREDFKVDAKLNEFLIGQAPDKENRFVRARSVIKK